MRDNYIALGVNTDCSALVFRPIVASGSNVMAHCIPLSGVQKQGLTEGGALVGAMLITALSAYHLDLDLYALLSKMTSPMPYKLMLDNHAEMRAQRMGLGLEADATGPAMLVVRAYDCDKSIGQDHLQSLKQLAELGKSVAPSVIGEIMLRKLAAMHPDVLPPLFPTMAL
jgi:hypothetical protein